jgi:hypothetical protein
VTSAVERLCEGLELDLCMTRLEHLALRNRLKRENTVENRSAEAECRARLDLLVELTDDAARHELARHQLHPARPGSLPAARPTG